MLYNSIIIINASETWKLTKWYIIKYLYYGLPKYRKIDLSAAYYSWENRTGGLYNLQDYTPGLKAGGYI